MATPQRGSRASGPNDALDLRDVSSQAKNFMAATTPSAARGLINAAAPPPLLAAGVTVVPIDTPVGPVYWRA